MNAPTWWTRGKFTYQTEYVNTVLATAIHTSTVKITQSGVDAVRLWATYPAESLRRYVSEQARNCSMRMHAMSRTSKWYELEQQFLFWRFLVTVCLCWKSDRSYLVPSVGAQRDALPFVSQETFEAWLREEGQRMLSGLGLLVQSDG